MGWIDSLNQVKQAAASQGNGPMPNPTTPPTGSPSIGVYNGPPPPIDSGGITMRSGTGNFNQGGWSMPSFPMYPGNPYTPPSNPSAPPPTSSAPSLNGGQLPGSSPTSPVGPQPPQASDPGGPGGMLGKGGGFGQMPPGLGGLLYQLMQRSPQFQQIQNGGGQQPNGIVPQSSPQGQLGWQMFSAANPALAARPLSSILPGLAAGVGNATPQFGSSLAGALKGLF